MSLSRNQNLCHKHWPLIHELTAHLILRRDTENSSDVKLLTANLCESFGMISGRRHLC